MHAAHSLDSMYQFIYYTWFIVIFQLFCFIISEYFMSNTNPLVSVIIPVFSRVPEGADYLKEAIASALAQSYKNIEVLVINDGSNDQGACEQVALSFGSQVRYFSKKNGGTASALNYGISKMRGQYFSWLSHDDCYLHDKIKNQIEMLKSLNDKNTLIYSGYNLIDHRSKLINQIIPSITTCNSPTHCCFLGRQILLSKYFRILFKNFIL